MSLRDGLARRLWETQGPEDVALHGGDDWDTILWREPPTAERFLRFADECIRQMEWARKECVGERWQDHEFAIDPSDRHIVDRGELPLTLAPPEWEP